MNNIQIGVIGTGGMGGRHAYNLSQRTPGVQVVAVMDVDAERAQQVAAECGGAQPFDDALALIHDERVEAVVIASPDWTHAELACACLAAGKPTLCEKPLATSTDDTRRVVEAELATGRRRLQLGFMREFDSAHLQVKRLLDKGELGAPLVFRSVHVNHRSGRVRTLEDVVINSAIHDFHSARWILGDAVAVSAQALPLRADEPDSCRLLLAQMRMANGSVALIEVNVEASWGYETDIEIVGSEGAARSDALPTPIVRSSVGRTQAIDADWLWRFETAYEHEVQAWVQSIREGCAVGPSAWDGYRSLVLAEACIHAARQGQPVAIEAEETPSLYER